MEFPFLYLGMAFEIVGFLALVVHTDKAVEYLINFGQTAHEDDAPTRVRKWNSKSRNARSIGVGFFLFGLFLQMLDSILTQ